jgi:hypothetical protein
MTELREIALLAALKCCATQKHEAPLKITRFKLLFVSDWQAVGLLNVSVQSGQQVPRAFGPVRNDRIKEAARLILLNVNVA